MEIPIKDTVVLDEMSQAQNGERICKLTNVPNVFVNLETATPSSLDFVRSHFF